MGPASTQGIATRDADPGRAAQARSQCFNGPWQGQNARLYQFRDTLGIEEFRAS